MKKIKLTKPFIYQIPGKGGRASVSYKTVGKIYERVPEDHAKAILDAECGEVVEDEKKFKSILSKEPTESDDQVSEDGGRAA